MELKNPHPYFGRRALGGPGWRGKLVLEILTPERGGKFKNQATNANSEIMGIEKGGFSAQDELKGFFLCLQGKNRAEGGVI